MAYFKGSGRFEAGSRFLALGFVGLAALGLTTCDLFKVGLGKKVDINAPTITLGSHETGAYVKGTITLSGDCADDVGVTAVTVTAAGVDTPFTADASAGTSWSLSLDTTALTDARTTFTATATDASGKTGSFEFLLFVDNTAPTVLVTSPLIYGPPDYPQQSDYLEVKGEVYDVSPITNVRVRVLNGAGAVLKEANADGSNTWTCRFDLKGTAGFTSAANDGTYYYFVEATDKGGNQSSFYYHRKDVRAIPSLTGKPFPSMDEIGELDQAGAGSAPSGFTFGELSARRLVSGASPAAYANFHFSFESLPDISFTNLDRNAITAAANELAIGSPITGLVVPPINGGAVDASTLAVYIYGSEAEHDASVPPIVTLNETAADDSDYILTKAIGDSLSFVITLKYPTDPDGAGPLAAGDDLAPDPEYYMEVVADAEGSHGSQHVLFSISAAAPILTETGIGSSTQSKNAAFLLSGSATHTLDLAGGFIDLEQAYNDPAGTYTHVTPSPHTLTLGAGTTVAWTTAGLGVSLPRDPSNVDAAAATDGSDDGLYYYRVTLTTPAGKTTRLERSVMFDTSGPTIAINEPAAGTPTVNGVIPLSASITDLNGIGEVRWGIAATEPAWASLSANILASPYNNGSVNADSYPEGATKLWVLAQDKAGNQSAASRDILIDYSSDDPVIALSNMNAAFNTAPQASGNLQGTGAKVEGTLTDDDSIDSSTLQISVDAAASWANVFASAPADGKNVSFTYTFTGLTQGVHYYYLRVTDLAAAKATRPAVTTTIGPVYFAYDTANPVLTETVVGGETIQYRNANLTFLGQASDTNAFSTLTYTVNGVLPANVIAIDADGPDNVAGNADDNAWSYLVDAASLSDGSYQYVFTATDVASRTTVITRNVVVDKTLPAATLTAVSGYQSSVVPISGTASDSGSGLTRVEYQLGGTGGAWTTAAGFDPWVGSLDVSSATEGDITLYARSVDRAGNNSVNQTATVQVDRANPRATETLHTAALIQTTGDVVFSGAADDAAVTALRAAASAVITWTKDGVAQTPVNLTPDADGPDNVAGNADDGYWTWTLLASNGDGLYVITLTVTDVAGKVSTVTRSVQIDTTAPILAITAPAASEQVSTSSYTFSGTSRDTGGVGFDGTADVEYSLNGGAWTSVAFTSGSAWATASAVSLGSQGMKTLNVRSTDRLGNQSTDSVTFYYDLAPPTLTETLVNSTSTQYRNADLPMGGNATDSNALSILTVSVDGGAASPVAVDSDGPDNIPGNADDGAWSYTVDVDTDGIGADTGLAEGTHSLLFTATDIAGKTTTVTRSVMVDTTDPTVGVNAVSGYQSGTIPIGGTAGDATGSGVLNVEFQLGASGWNAASGTSPWSGSLNLSTAAEGSMTLYARAYDRAGNASAIESTPILVDRSQPRATETNHGAALIRSAADVVFAGTADDAAVTALRAASSAAISWTKDGVAQADVPLSPDADGPDNVAGNADDGYWTWTLPAATGDGLYGLTLTVTDVAGKVSTVTRSVHIDTAAPSLSVSAPTAGALVIVSTTDFSGSASDIGGVGFDGTDDVEYSLNDGAAWTGAGGWNPITLSGTSWSAAGVSLGTEGQKTVRIRATDRIGNTTFQDVSFYHDASAPTLSETTIGTSAEVLTNADVTLAGTASDTNSLTSVTINATKNGVSVGQVYIDNVTPASWSYTMSVGGGANDGLWAFAIVATDIAGRTTQVNRNVRVDTQAPSVSISLPTAGSYATGTTYTASGGASDNGTLSLVQYSTDGATWNAVTGMNSWTVSLNLATLGEGARTLYVRAQDAAGNWSGNVTRNFIVDINPPSLTETGVGTGTIYRNALFALSGNVGDGVDLASLNVTQNRDGLGASEVYSTSWAGASDTASAWSVPSLPSGGAVPGVYEFIVTVTDSAGKSTSLTRTVTVDTTDPTVEITSVLPILSGAVVNGRITLSATANDASGLTGVRYFIRAAAGVPAYTDGDGIAMTAPYSAVINTTTLTDDAPAYLYVVALDRAGNDSSHLATVNVDQGSDYPTVTIESPVANDAIGADRMIRGTFSDDDGVAANGATLYVKKSTSGTYSSISIPNASSAGQLVAWAVDVSAVLTAGGDGTYNAYLRVYDDSSKKSGLGSVYTDLPVQNFTYDNSPPTVSATLTKTPSQAAYREGDSVVIGWTASDASGISAQVFDMDGVSTGLGALQNPSGDSFNVTYTVPVGSTSGNKTFTLVVTDATGRSTTRTATFLIDVDAPTVEAAMTLEPAFVGFTPNGAFTVKGTAADNRGLSNVQVQLTGPDGSLAWTNATLVNGVWSYAIADSAAYVAANGTLQVEVRAYDQAGNVSATQTFNRAVDQAADLPTVSVLSPVADATYGTSVQLSGTAADDDNLADIDNDTVIDANAITIEYEGLSPVVAVQSVNPTSITGSGKNATFNHSLTLTGGTWRMRARSMDDNSTSGAWTAWTNFTVDTGAPIMSVDANAAFTSGFTTGTTLTITGTASDSGGLKYVRARVNGGSWVLASAAGMVDVAPADGIWDSLAMGNTPWTISLGLGSDGLKTVEIAAADNLDITTTAQRSTTLDSTLPTGTFDASFKDNPTGSPLALNALNKVVRVTGTVTELNLRDTDPVEISIDGGAFAPVTGTFVWSYVWDTTALSGAHSLTLRVTDKAGLFTDSIVANVTIDQSADVPVITQAFVPAGNSSLAGNNVLGTLQKVSGTLSDDDGFNVGAVNLYVDGSATPIGAVNTAGTTATWEYTFSGGSSLAQGEHYYTIQATDRNGLAQSLGPTYFLVDTENPTLGIGSPAAGAKVRAGTLTISGTASDSGGLGASPVGITLRHSNTGSSLHNDAYSLPVSLGAWSQDVVIDGDVLDGTLYIDVLLTDRAGKTSSVTRAVTIDMTAPSLTLTYPSVDAYINGLISITGTADDLNGLADVSLEILDPATRTVPRAVIARTSSGMAAWEFSFNSALYTTGTYGFDVNSDGTLWQVWFRLAATDNSGNVTYYQPGGAGVWPSIYIDTDGDKPTISVTQPKNGDTIGGFVTMFGTATDDDGPVMHVEVQIDFNGDGDYVDTRDINNNDSDGNPATGIELGSDQDFLGNIVRVGNATYKWEDEAAWYLVPVSNSSWTLELNSSGELYRTNTGGATGAINIRTRSRDANGLASEISVRTITLDETYPRIEGISPADQTYQHGTFDLIAAFGDQADLPLGTPPNANMRVVINKTTTVHLTEGAYVPVTHPYSLTADLGEPQNGYDLVYPIDTSLYFPGSSGVLYVDLYVRDASNYVNQKSFTYYVDNQVPTSSWSDSSTRPDGSNLRNGMITVNGANRTYVEGNYGDSGSVSGISRVEMYFVKSGAVRSLKASGTWSGTPGTETASVETYDLGSNTWNAPANQSTEFVSHGSMAVVGAGSIVAARSYTIVSLGTTDFTAIGAASNTVGLTFTATGAGSGTGTANDNATANDYVIRVDRTNEMSSLTLGTDSDGDGYHEFQGIYEGSPRWRAYFDSQYLPDGIADLHYVVYDLAGNRIHKMRQVFIANNGPVIDSIQLGSDLNASGTVANIANVNEITDYYNPALSVDRSDFQKVKNLRLYLGVEGSDPVGGVRQIFVDVYDAAGTTFLGNAYTSGLNPAGGDASATIAISIGTAPWTGTYVGGKIDYNLKVTVRDTDSINVSRWAKVSVYNPADATPPVLTLNPLAQADQDGAIGHLELQGDNDAGVWSTIIAAYGGDNDPKASGKIVYKGTITDENRVNAITVASQNNPDTSLAIWSGGTLVADADGFSILSQTLGENGHTVNFRYEWDSSYVNGTAGLNRTVTFDGQDGALNSAVDAASTVDVVPYITSLARDTDFNTIRSRYGRYLFRRTEELNVIGFNVFATTGDTLAFTGAGASVNLPSGSTKVLVTVNVPAAATSGNLTLTVNGVPAINNLNDNSKAWNSEASATPSLDGSAYWNDDRTLHVWQSNDDQGGNDRGYFTGSLDPEYPAMSFNPATRVLYGSWENYADADVYYAPNNGAATRIFHAYDPQEHTDIHYGSRPTVAINANMYGNGAWDVGGAGGTYVWDSQATDVNDYSGDAYAGVYNAEALYHDQKLMQFINQRIVTNGNNIHVSYYDTDTKALKYWYRLSGNNSAYAQTWINIDGGSDFHDNGAPTNVMGSGGTWRTVSDVYVTIGQAVTAGQNLLRQSNGAILTAPIAGTVGTILAVGDWVNNTVVGATVWSATPSRTVSGSRSAAAGEYSAIDVTPTNFFPVIAYYDITNQTVKLARATAVNPTAAQWSLQTVMTNGVDPNYRYSGKYVSMKIDTAGYVHLVFYRNSTGDLIYMKSTNNPTNGATAYTFGNSVVIDSIGSVGVWADLTLNGTTPYVSYLDSSLVNTFDGIKMAYYDAALERETGDTDGQPDTADGWETMNAPLGYEVESVRTSIEFDTGGTGFWSAAIGYSSPDYFRIAYYVKQ